MFSFSATFHIRYGIAFPDIRLKWATAKGVLDNVASWMFSGLGTENDMWELIPLANCSGLRKKRYKQKFCQAT